MKNLSYFFSIIFMCTVNLLVAQLTPEKAIEGMGRGINLGNTLEPPFEGSWNNGPAEESYFDAYVEAGFSNIRIPVRWDEHTEDSAPFAIDPAWMNRVEEVVDWGLSRGFYITLNGHHEDWLKNNYNNANLRARYDAIWVQVANRFKDKSEKLLFEIINEPNGMSVSQVDDLNERILGIIRQTNPTRNVIYGGNMYANSEQLFTAKIPNDDYIVGYYHAYDPWQFSGQGMGTWGTSFDYQQLNNKYQAVKNWSITNGIPIHHSEFGAIHACDYNSRMRIYAHNVERCMAHGFAFSVWDDGGDFRVLNRGNNTWPEVKDILMHYHTDSPNQIFSTFSLNSVTDESQIEVKWNNRTTDNGEIVLERATSVTNAFVEIATLSSDSEAYLDTDVQAGVTYTYRMYTSKADGTLLHGYPTRVRVTATVQSTFNAEPIAIPGILEVEEYDNGGEGLAYHDTEAANIPGGFRTDEGVDIGESQGDYILEYVANGEWIEYTVNVEKSGIYSVKADVGSEVANGAFSVNFDKNNSTTGFSCPSTGNWYTFTDISANNTIELEEGTQVMRLAITNNNAFNVDNLTFTLESTNSIAEEEAVRAGFIVSPNPTDGVLFIEVPASLVGMDSEIEVLNFIGQVVTRQTIQNLTTSIQLQGIENGIYVVKLTKGKKQYVHRVIKQ